MQKGSDQEPTFVDTSDTFSGAAAASVLTVSAEDATVFSASVKEVVAVSVEAATVFSASVREALTVSAVVETDSLASVRAEVAFSKKAAAIFLWLEYYVREKQRFI